MYIVCTCILNNIKHRVYIQQIIQTKTFEHQNHKNNHKHLNNCYDIKNFSTT